MALKCDLHYELEMQTVALNLHLSKFLNGLLAFYASFESKIRLYVILASINQKGFAETLQVISFKND